MNGFWYSVEPEDVLPADVLSASADVCHFRVQKAHEDSFVKLTHPKHYQFCIGGSAFDTDGLWKPTKDGLGYARVLDYIGVRY